MYFGTPYPTGTKFYDNIGNFFQTGVTQKHNVAFSGDSPEGRLNYRVSAATTRERWVIPGSDLNKVNLTGASQGKVTSWLNADLSMMYDYANNDQPYKGDDGPLIGLLAWPDTNNASNWLTPAGTRARITSLGAGSEIDNPYFNVSKNKINAKTNRLTANTAITVIPFSWGNLKTNLGVDSYTNSDLLLRHPESQMAVTQNGILDIDDDVTRNLNAQTVFSLNDLNLGKGFRFHGLLGNAVQDNKSTVDGSEGINFLDPNFVSINNTSQKYSRTIITQRRLVSGFGLGTLGYNDYLYVTLTGRNDWTSTIPQARNSFFYPSVSGSFVFTDAFPGLHKYFTSGKLRAAYAEVGRDAAPYSYRTTLEAKTTSFGGYGYGFTGPNPALEPEFAKSYEFGTELSFLDDRLGIDATMYHKHTDKQIVQNVRESYGTGFILFNLNGATTENHGVELSVRAAPVAHRDVLVGRPGELHAGTWQDARPAQRAAGIVRLRHVAVRQRPQRHGAGAVDDVAHRLVLPPQQGLQAPDRSDDRSADPLDDVRRRRVHGLAR